MMPFTDSAILALTYIPYTFILYVRKDYSEFNKL